MVSTYLLLVILYVPVNSSVCACRYEDPNVSYNQVYLAHSFETGFFALGALFDFTVMLGMLIDPWESIGNLVKYKVKRRVKMLKKRSGKTRQQASG